MKRTPLYVLLSALAAACGPVGLNQPVRPVERTHEFSAFVADSTPHPRRTLSDITEAEWDQDMSLLTEAGTIAYSIIVGSSLPRSAPDFRRELAYGSSERPLLAFFEFLGVPAPNPGSDEDPFEVEKVLEIIRYGSSEVADRIFGDRNYLTESWEVDIMEQAVGIVYNVNSPEDLLGKDSNPGAVMVSVKATTYRLMNRDLTNKEGETPTEAAERIYALMVIEMGPVRPRSGNYSPRREVPAPN